MLRTAALAALLLAPPGRLADAEDDDKLREVIAPSAATAVLVSE